MCACACACACACVLSAVHGYGVLKDDSFSTVTPIISPFQNKTAEFCGDQIIDKTRPFMNEKRKEAREVSRILR